MKKILQVTILYFSFANMMICASPSYGTDNLNENEKRNRERWMSRGPHWQEDAEIFDSFKGGWDWKNNSKSNTQQNNHTRNPHNSYTNNYQVPYQASYSLNINYSSQKSQALQTGLNAHKSLNPYKTDPDFEQQLEIRKQYLATLQASGQQEVYCNIWTKQFEGYKDDLGKFYVGYRCIHCGHQQFHSQYYDEYKKPNEYALPMMDCRGCNAKSGY